VVVLSAAVCAVAAGARSFVAVAEWVADLPAELAVALGTDRRCPSESAIRRLLGRVDADRFDAVIGGFVQDRCTSVTSPGRWRALALHGLAGVRELDPGGDRRPCAVSTRRWAWSTCRQGSANALPPGQRERPYPAEIERIVDEWLREREAERQHQVEDGGPDADELHRCDGDR